MDEKIASEKILLAGFWYTVIAVMLQQIEVVFTMKYYQDPALAPIWSKLMMPSAGPPPLAFFIISFVFTFGTGCTLAAVYEFTHDLFGAGYWKKVIGFTDVMVGLSIVFGFFPMYLLLNIPVGLLGWWLASSFVTILISAKVFAHIIK